MGRKALMRIVVAAAAYVIAGKVGLSLAVVNASASPVWVPTGIAIASCVLLGRAVWPGIFLAAFIVNVTTAGSVATSLAIASGNTLEGLLGAWLIATLCGGVRVFERIQDVFRFALVALVAPVASATIGVTALAIGGYAAWSMYADVWTTWWLGDVSGALIVTPLIITWVAPRELERPSALELLGLGAVTLVVGGVVFLGFHPLSVSHAPIAFVTFPLFAWAAYRHGPRGASLTIAVLAAIAGWGTLHGFGPFVLTAANDSLLFVQSFMAIAALTSLTLAAADLQRRRADAALRAGEERLRRAEQLKVQERDEFLSIAAHELRTPITSLQLAAQFLYRQIERRALPGSAELTNALQTVTDQSAKLTRLVSQLLDNVRVDADRLTIDREYVDISALVLSVAEEVRRVSGRQDILVVASAASAYVDPLRLEQVLRNLLDNAVKFSPKGGAIDVRVTSVDSARVTITVRDHGIGVPEEHRAALFQRYQQVHGRHYPGGLGLGLYDSRQIMERHGGQIDAQFPDDGGTRIIVTLPAPALTLEAATASS